MSKFLCKLKHSFYRVPEPNEFKFSVKICRRCGLTQRYTINFYNSHWMQHLVGFYSQHFPLLKKIREEQGITVFYDEQDAQKFLNRK